MKGIPAIGRDLLAWPLYLIISTPDPEPQLFQEPLHSSPNFIPSFFGNLPSPVTADHTHMGVGLSTEAWKQMYGPSPNTSLNVSLGQQLNYFLLILCHSLLLSDYTRRVDSVQRK